MKVELEDGKLRGMCRSSCHLFLAEMPKNLFTPETPVDAKVLEKAWRSLGKTLGEILALRWPK
jgi:hypothetical protein